MERAGRRVARTCSSACIARTFNISREAAVAGLGANWELTTRITSRVPCLHAAKGETGCFCPKAMSFVVGKSGAVSICRTLISYVTACPYVTGSLQYTCITDILCYMYSVPGRSHNCTTLHMLRGPEISHNWSNVYWRNPVHPSFKGEGEAARNNAFTSAG